MMQDDAKCRIEVRCEPVLPFHGGVIFHSFPAFGRNVACSHSVMGRRQIGRSSISVMSDASCSSPEMSRTKRFWKHGSKFQAI